MLDKMAEELQRALLSDRYTKETRRPVVYAAALYAAAVRRGMKDFKPDDMMILLGIMSWLGERLDALTGLPHPAAGTSGSTADRNEAPSVRLKPGETRPAFEKADTMPPVGTSDGRSASNPPPPTFKFELPPPPDCLSATHSGRVCDDCRLSWVEECAGLVAKAAGVDKIETVRL